MRIARGAIALALSLAATGCASIVSGVNQSVSVQTKLDGQPVTGAACRLWSNKGTWFVTTPGSVTVHRGFQDLEVECTKEGVPTGLAQFASSTKALAFGNIILGGAIGVGVDVGTGAAYDYPELLSIDMGRSTARLSEGDLVLKAKADAVARPAAASTTRTTQVDPPYASNRPPVVPAGLASGVPEVAPPVQTQWKKPRAVPLGLASGAPEFVAPQTATSAPPRPDAAVTDASPLRYRAIAERFARTRACHPQPVAALSATGPVSETYTIACQDGEPMVARCEADECRELK